MKSLNYIGCIDTRLSYTPLLKHTCGEVTGCHVGYQGVDRCHTRDEFHGMYIMKCHSVFETQGKCHQKFKTRVSVAPQKDLCSPKIKKNTNYIYFPLDYTRNIPRCKYHECHGRPTLQCRNPQCQPNPSLWTGQTPVPQLYSIPQETNFLQALAEFK